jgi:tetratricopeptide (TPR) repeat protein
MYQQALQGDDKALGPYHGPTLRTINNMGNLYTSQGNLDEAEKMYQQALKGKEEVLGPNHTSILATVNNLGTVYRMRGKLGEAEKMYRRALQGYEKALSLEIIRGYRPALNTMWSMGDLFAAQGHLDKAKEMYSRAYTGLQVILGPSSDVCQTISRSIASLDSMQGTIRDISLVFSRCDIS